MCAEVSKSIPQKNKPDQCKFTQTVPKLTERRDYDNAPKGPGLIANCPAKAVNKEDTESKPEAIDTTSNAYPVFSNDKQSQ